MDPTLLLTPAGLQLSNATALDHFVVVSNEGMPSVDLPHVATIRWEVNLSENPDLVTINMPALVNAGVVSRGGFNTSNCVALANVWFPNYLPTNNRPHTFNNCALTQTSVDHILSRLVASAVYVYGQVNLDGGTNAAPSAAGLADVATLRARAGIVVTHN